MRTEYAKIDIIETYNLKANLSVHPLVIGVIQMYTFMFYKNDGSNDARDYSRNEHTKDDLDMICSKRQLLNGIVCLTCSFRNERHLFPLSVKYRSRILHLKRPIFAF